MENMYDDMLDRLDRLDRIGGDQHINVDARQINVTYQQDNNSKAKGTKNG